jgi:acyl-coenzyme A synthetase/AMP-(fatty) acid ligase
MNISPGSLVGVRCRNPNVEILTNLGLMRAGMRVGIAGNKSTYAEHGVVLDVLLTDGSTHGGKDVAARRHIPLTPDWVQPHEFSNRKIEPTDYGLIFASSGSTGASKLLFASRENIDYRVDVKSGEPWFHEDMRFMTLSQPNSMTSFLDAVITLVKGGQVVRLDAMPPAQTLDAITVFQPTYVNTPPYTLVSLLEGLKTNPRKLRKIDYLRVAGAYCSPQVRASAKELLASHVITSYGATETGRIAFAELEDIAGIDGAVGAIMAGLAVETVDDSGAPLPQGETGELRVKPPAESPLSYFSSGELISPLKDGWFYPGDIGRVDEKNNLIISGRKSSVINMGGNKVDPERVESALIRIDGIEDVAVGPFRSASGYDVIVALVKSSGPIQLEQLTQFLEKNRQIYRIDSIRRVSSIPRNTNGKIDRRAVLEQIKSPAKH